MEYKTPRTQSTCSPDPRPWIDEVGITKCPSYTHALVRPLFDLMTDAFDDVRALASSCLYFVLESWSRALTLRIDIPQKVHIAEQLMRTTGRADHADGFARLFRLHCQIGPQCPWPKGNADALEHALASLKADVAIAGSHMRSAVENSPLHGHIITLRCGLPKLLWISEQLTMLTDTLWNLKHPAIIRHVILRTGCRRTTGTLC